MNYRFEIIYNSVRFDSVTDSKLKNVPVSIFKSVAMF